MSYNTRYEGRYQALGNAPEVPTCSHKTPPGALYCPMCGQPVGTVDIDKQIKKWIEKKRSGDNWEFMYGWDTDNGSCSWYNWTRVMVETSQHFPHVLFELTGWGEETGDYWKAYFLNGKYYKSKAIFPDFDIALLQTYPTT